MDCSVIPRLAAPLNLPADLASVTVPLTGDPAGIALTPPTDTEWDSVPLNPCPVVLSLELNPLPRLTDNVVPAGTTIGGGGGAGAGSGAGAATGGSAAAGAGALSAGADAAGAAAGAGALEEGCVAAGSLAGAAVGCDVACSWSDDFLHPEKSNPADSSRVTRKSF